MKQLRNIDVKLVRFCIRICRSYLKKRKFPQTEIDSLTPDKIQSHLLPFIKSGSKMNYIDIGAHKGNMVDELSKHYKFGKVILAEPVSELADLLKKKYHNRGFYIYQNIISDIQKENIDFFINELSGTSSLLEFKSDMKELSNINTNLLEVQKLQSKTLDSIVKECQIENIDLIKIDVQGAEHLVLTGGKETLRKTRFIWTELSFKPLYEKSSVFTDIYSQLEKENFILLNVLETHRGPNQELLQIDALFGNNSFFDQKDSITV